MPRARGGFKTRRRRKKILKMARGYYGAKSRLFRVATEAVDRSLRYAYRDRRVKKREFRSLWIVRINAAVRSLGMTYSQFNCC
jgi:large subunit ribosomal protein L20